MKKFWMLLTLTTIVFYNFNLILNPAPGLDKAVPIGPFINNKLPSIAPAANQKIGLTRIYAELKWESPIVAIPFPETNNMLIAEMDGRLFTVSNSENTKSRNMVLDIRNRCWYYDWAAPGTKHGGIQNIVFHPKFGQGESKDYIYVYYLVPPSVGGVSGNNYYNRLSRFSWNGSSFSNNSELIMINQFDSARGHDGSGMAFGKDGFLYIGVGDEGSQNAAATEHTQKLNDRFRSGVWRLDVDMKGGNVSHPIIRQPNNSNVPNGGLPSYTQGYFIPNNNPWVDSSGGTLEEFYAVGLRQPYRMTYDAPTGNFWIGDVGGGKQEEIDVMNAPGLNFEWNYKEGTANGFRDKPSPFIGTARSPIYADARKDLTCVIGGYVYRGSDIGQLQGKYIYGDLRSGNVFALDYAGGNSHNGIENITKVGSASGTFSGIGSFGVNHDDEILVLRLSAGGTDGEGEIYRISATNSGGGAETLPEKLSQTGIFSNLNNLTTNPGIIPYDVNNPLWSAGTLKKRWVALPNDGNVNSNSEKIDYKANGDWGFPEGTVFIKHFGHPDGKKLETRVWINGTDGNWFGATYKWNNNGTEANLLTNGEEEKLSIEGETFNYLYPSVSQCGTCHTSSAGWVLGFNTQQLNKNVFYPSTGLVGNQLETLNHLGFIPSVNTNTVLTAAALNDNSASLELRARSYLESNCAHCHQPGGVRGAFDARIVTALNNQGLINGTVEDNLGISGAKVIVPQDLSKSALYQRMKTEDECCLMPQLGRGRMDKEGLQTIANWINSINADCANNTNTKLGNNLSDGNFIDGHKPAMNINKSDAYTNNSGKTEQICLVNFDFYARRKGNPVTPFIAKVNGTNNFTILSVGQSRTASEYKVGNNSFAFSNHSDDVLMLAPGETIVTGFLDAFPDGTGGENQSVIPAQSANGEDEVWQTYTNSGNLRPNLRVGNAPGLASNTANNLKRTYKFNISIDVDEATVTPPNPTNNNNCSVNIPGKIEAENFCNQFGVKAETTGDTGGGQNIGFVQKGDWMEYEIKVSAAGSYKVNYRIAANGSNGGAIQLQINNSKIGSINLPSTGGWQTYTTVNNEVNLPQGNHTLRVFAEQAGWNLNWLLFEETTTTPSTPSTGTSLNHIAIGKPASQSSTTHSGAASRAVDGNAEGAWSKSSVSHTSDEDNAWWRVDLKDLYTITSIKIHNRTDACCKARIEGVELYAGTINNTNPGDYKLVGSLSNTKVNSFNNLNISASYIMLRHKNSGVLSLAEVEVHGTLKNDENKEDLKVVLYDGCNFGSTNMALKVGEYPVMPNTGFPNDKLSSIKVPNGLKVSLYKHYNFSGTSIELTADENCLTNKNFDNAASSLKIAFNDEQKLSNNLNSRLNKIVLTPNPANDIINLDLSYYADEPVEYSINSVLNNTILKGSFDKSHANMERIDISELPNAIYMIIFKFKNNTIEAKKFIVY